MNLKEHKRKLIISSTVILLPIVFGLIFWDQLPDIMTTHWGIDNKPDGWTSKTFAVFFMPLLLLAFHWLCLWLTSMDKSQKNQTKKAITMIFWIIPMVSLFTSAIMYGTALGSTINITSILFVMLGLMFIFIGNYLPKTKQNRHLGIKLVWTLNNEENWNATHRFGGKVWVFGGLLISLGSFFPMKYTISVILPITLLLAVVPTLYSYLYYKKQCREGRSYSLKASEQDKNITRFSIAAVLLILIFVAFVMFNGEITCVYSDHSFTIEASFYDDLTVEYDAIDSIALRNEPIPGSRTFGFGSARLLLGIFENEEFGSYTRYTYHDPEACVILTSGEKILVISGKDAGETQEIYDTILKYLE